MLGDLLLAASRALDEHGEAVRPGALGCTFKHYPEVPLATRIFIGEPSIKWGFFVGADLHLVSTRLSPGQQDPPSATGCPSHAAAVSCV